jgi:hypothetical protein
MEIHKYDTNKVSVLNKLIYTYVNMYRNNIEVMLLMSHITFKKSN